MTTIFYPLSSFPFYGGIPLNFDRLPSFGQEPIQLIPISAEKNSPNF
jgi:hypothetical protein